MGPAGVLYFGLKDGRSEVSVVVEMRRTAQTWLSVILVRSRLLFRVNRENVCSLMYVEPNGLFIRIA